MQKPVMTCSSVTGTFGLSGRGKPASVGGGGGERVENRRQARAVRVAGGVRDGGILQACAGCSVKRFALRCCKLCALQRLDRGQNGWWNALGGGVVVYKCQRDDVAAQPLALPTVTSTLVLPTLVALSLTLPLSRLSLNRGLVDRGWPCDDVYVGWTVRATLFR